MSKKMTREEKKRFTKLERLAMDSIATECECGCNGVWFNPIYGKVDGISYVWASCAGCHASKVKKIGEPMLLEDYVFWQYWHRNS